MFASALRMSVYFVAVKDGEKEGIILRLRPKEEEKEEKRNSNWRVVGEGRSPRRQQDVVFILPHKGRCVRQQERGRENKGERAISRIFEFLCAALPHLLALCKLI